MLEPIGVFEDNIDTWNINNKDQIYFINKKLYLLKIVLIFTDEQIYASYIS